MDFSFFVVPLGEAVRGGGTVPEGTFGDAGCGRRVKIPISRSLACPDPVSRFLISRLR